MNLLITFATITAAVHVSDSYILLTANIDDVKNIAQQIVNSPIVSEVKDIVMRATGVFKKHIDNTDGSDRNRQSDDRFDLRRHAKTRRSGENSQNESTAMTTDHTSINTYTIDEVMANNEREARNNTLLGNLLSLVHKLSSI